MPVGLCPMCSENRTLLDSHFMPASIYVLCGTPEYPPVRMTEQVMMPTTRQIHDHLFCFDCEQRLSREGEAWTIPLLSVHGGPFPLRERLVKHEPMWNDGSTAIFAAGENSEIDVAKLTHFGVGIFYKGAVHPWRGNKDEPWIALEPEEIAALRKYLQGEAELPSNMAMSVIVDSSPVCYPAFHEPYRTQHAEFKSYCTFVPGVVFNLFIGPNAQTELKGVCINGDPFAPVQFAEMAKELRGVSREEARRSRPTKKLIETTAEIEAKGLSVKLGD
jgi:hypothetical protein